MQVDIASCWSIDVVQVSRNVIYTAAKSWLYLQAGIKALIPSPVKRQRSPNLSSSSSYWRLAIKWLIILALAQWYVASAAVTGWTVISGLVGQCSKHGWKPTIKLYQELNKSRYSQSCSDHPICLHLWLVEQSSMVWLANAINMDGSRL